MAMTLQQAIDFAVAPSVPAPYGIEVEITVSMHDDDGFGTVLVGHAHGLSDMFRPDLALLNYGMATLAGPGGAGTTGGGWLRKGPAPGFSTRGLGPGQGADASMEVVTGTGSGTSIPIDFSVRKDPGIPWLRVFGSGPSVQIEIETLSAPAPGGAVTGGIKLGPVEETGTLLRAAGPSLLDTTKRASYTATIVVFARPG
jgi:hypothetical protein